MFLKTRVPQALRKTSRRARSIPLRCRKSCGHGILLFVAYNARRYTLSISSRMPPEQPPQKPSSPYEAAVFAAELGAEMPEVDLHGMDVHDALQALEHAIDQAIYHHEEALRVIHGRGTGRLRDAIHAYLKTHSEQVGLFRDSQAPGRQGGVTIVALRTQGRKVRFICQLTPYDAEAPLCYSPLHVWPSRPRIVRGTGSRFRRRRIPLLIGILPMYSWRLR